MVGQTFSKLINQSTNRIVAFVFCEFSTMKASFIALFTLVVQASGVSQASPNGGASKMDERQETRQKLRQEMRVSDRKDSRKQERKQQRKQERESERLVQRQASSPARICCLAMTAECLACGYGIDVEEYCSKEPNTVGCPLSNNPVPVESFNPEPSPMLRGAKSPSPPQSCCKAMTAQCLACTEGMTEKDFCAKYAETVGCEPVAEAAYEPFVISDPTEEESCVTKTCAPGQNCQMCWGAAACIPNGAVC